MTQLTAHSAWTTGQQVTGVYCGQAFRGAINGETRGTADSRNVQFWISLDEAITVFGASRSTICVETNSKNNAVFAN